MTIQPVVMKMTNPVLKTFLIFLFWNFKVKSNKTTEKKKSNIEGVSNENDESTSCDDQPSN